MRFYFLFDKSMSVIQFAPKTVQKLLLPGILSSPLSHRIPAKSMI
jgi:hypothetical protein